MLCLGRGTCHAIALEAALKLKEICYIHAEGYAAGEMKHGPIALIDRQVPILAIAPSGPLFEKTASNVQEAGARGGQVVILSDATRDEPRSAMLQALLEELSHVPAAQITLIVASGTHAPRAPETVIDRESLARHPVVVHDGGDLATMSDLGSTSRGTRVKSSPMCCRVRSTCTSKMAK